MKFKSIAFITLSVCVFLVPISCQETFLTKSEREQLFDLMLHEIESIDAEAIETRNASKTTQWQDYVSGHKEAIINAEDSDQLKSALDAFFSGFVNLHARYKYWYPHQNLASRNWKSEQKLGVTFPELEFFEIGSSKKLTHLNGKDISAEFNSFNDLRCRGSNSLYCAKRFISKIHARTFPLDGDTLANYTLENGEVVRLTYDTIPGQDRYSELTKAIEIGDEFDGWERIDIGYKVAVLRNENIALVKIKDFVYPKGNDGGLRCEQVASDSTQCGDIQLIRRALASLKQSTEHLIIDLQDNYGGNENSRFIAELCPDDFTDLAVQFRKKSFLNDPHLRGYLFYGSERTENWYQELQMSGAYEKVKEGDFFETIGDFCRGSETCQLEDISPNPTARQDWKSITILTNEGTASSGDDFTYRLHRFGNAMLVGQPQCADLTYSLVKVIFYVNSANEIKRKYVSNPRTDYEVSGDLIFECDIPLTRSIDENGDLLQGNPLDLDIAVPLTSDNYTVRNKAVLEQAVLNIAENH